MTDLERDHLLFDMANVLLVLIQPHLGIPTTGWAWERYEALRASVERVSGDFPIVAQPDGSANR